MQLRELNIKLRKPLARKEEKADEGEGSAVDT
jgi:hypothetical protein